MSAISQLFPPKPTYTEKNVESLSGKVFIVTGGNAGVGFEIAKILYSKGGKVYITCRSQSKAIGAIEKLKSLQTTTPGELDHLILDLADLTTIKAAVTLFISQETRLDVLWNNAGIASVQGDAKTPQGHELRIGTNCLGPYLLTKLLLPIMQRTAATAPPASVRVIFTSSVAVVSAPEGGVVLSELEPSAHVADQGRYYSASKVGNWFFASEFDRHVRQHGIVCLTQNPGNLRTKIWDDSGFLLRTFMKVTLHDPKLGAYTGIWAGLGPDVKLEDGGRYAIPWGRWGPSPRKDIAEAFKTKEEGGSGIAGAFWDWCELQSSRYS